jgi:hypothetical protein
MEAFLAAAGLKDAAGVAAHLADEFEAELGGDLGILNDADVEATIAAVGLKKVSATKLRDAWALARHQRAKDMKLQKQLSGGKGGLSRQTSGGGGGGAADGGGSGGGGGGGPAQMRNGPGFWDFFLSHTQRSGKATTLAAELFADLEGRGFSCWLDVKMEDMSEAAMEEGVKGAKVCLAIITDDGGPGQAYFERPYCVQELRWAKESGVAVQPIVDTDDKKRIGELLAKAPDDLRADLGASMFIDLIRSNKQYWDVGTNMVVDVL